MKIKKTTTLFLAVALLSLLLSSCANTSYIATIGNEKLPIGPYAFYAYYTRDNYQSNLSNYGVTDFTSALTEQADSNGTKLYSYIISETKNSYIKHIITERKFEEFGLSFTEEQQTALDESFQTNWVNAYGIEAFSDLCKSLNMTSAEFRQLSEITYKNVVLLDYLFGEGGKYEITDDEIKNNYAQNYERFKYIALAKVNADGATLPTDELIAKKALVDEAYQRALDGEDFGLLISEYSEDYLPITDDLTEEEKTFYAQQNEQSANDGLVIDTNGIFNYDYYYYYNYYIDAEIVNKVFSMAVGEIAVVELSSSFWIIQKCDKNEKEDYYLSKESLIYNTIVAPILDSLYTEWENELLITFNESAVNKYDPRKIGSLFLTQ